MDVVDLPGRTALWRRSLTNRTTHEFVLAAAVVAYVLFYGNYVVLEHNRFQTFGFDLGIFAQGTWLLAHFHDPFVTLRGLDLFGDHASFILIVLAPIYRLWSDPRALLLLQVIATAVPAIVTYCIGAKRIGPTAGLAVALAYLLYPAMQWAAVWQFHPETLATAFLSLAALTAELRRHRWLAVFVGLALLCKEDVSFVVFGFGAALWLRGNRRPGLWVATAAAVYFVAVTFGVMHLINGSGNLYFQRNYGISQHGIAGVALGLPHVVSQAWSTAINDKGLLYLTLVFLPLLMLPLLDWRGLLPTVPPLLLNLGSNVPYQQQIHFQYLATSAPFLALATIGGLTALRTRQGPSAPMTAGSDHNSILMPGERGLVPVLLALLVMAAALSWTHGPVDGAWQLSRTAASAGDLEKRTALATIPAGAVVSAQYDLDPHLTSRTGDYEFPNPFAAANWGMPGDEPSDRMTQSVRYVIVEPTNLGASDRAVYDELAISGQWQSIFSGTYVTVLRRTAQNGS